MKLMKYHFIVCVLYFQIPSGDLYPETEELDDFVARSVEDRKEYPQYELDNKAGDLTELRGIDRHKHVPYLYKDFSRRFVLQYPYTEKKVPVDVKSEASLDKAVLTALKKTSFPERAVENDSLKPVKAPPEVVLAVAKQSLHLQAATPPNPSYELIQKDILRTGNYWNAVWKEDVPKPDTVLRSNLVPVPPKLESIRVKIMPGSKLHQLVSLTKRISPKLLYIITNKKAN